MSVVISKNMLIFSTGYKFRVSVSRVYHKKSQDGLMIFDDCVTVFYNNANHSITQQREMSSFQYLLASLKLTSLCYNVQKWRILPASNAWLYFTVYNF